MPRRKQRATLRFVRARRQLLQRRDTEPLFNLFFGPVHGIVLHDHAKHRVRRLFSGKVSGCVQPIVFNMQGLPELWTGIKNP